MTPLEQARQLIAAASRIAVLTGAGVSAESGVPTFRGPGGLWRNYRPEDLATPAAFARNPELVWEWYLWRRARIAEAVPNPGHWALAQWERRVPQFTLITQNVDGLHVRAGSRHVLQVHGDIWLSRCTACIYQRVDKNTAYSGIPSCPDCGAMLRPGVVWFGETLPRLVWQAAERAAHGTQVLLIAGTSAQVHPAAGLIDIARDGGAKTIEINVDDTPYSGNVTVALRGPTGDLLPALLSA
ncbi:MAG TPA: NAD-dependent deacylase [Bryobacteraceae bacterium]|nr:NAD-dependent deacylase [Bryobacteraceae bacterium]